MTKKMNVDSIANELKGSSLYFTDKDNRDSTNERTDVSTDGVSNTITDTERNYDTVVGTDIKRDTKRYPFDFYVDQLEILSELDNISRNKKGRSFNKSKYIREALDEKLKKDGLL